MISLRRADQSDVQAVLACAQTAYEGYVAAIGKRPGPMDSDYDALVAKGHVTLALNRSDGLLGFLVCYPMNGAMFLENVAVHPDHQGKRVGAKLITWCEILAQDNNLSAVQLYTNEKMTANLTLYPKLGYIETHRTSEHGFNRVYFEKRL